MSKIVRVSGFPLVAVVLFGLLGHCEMSIYPGLRRKPLQSLQQSFEVPSDFLAQLMEDNARRRLQQQFEQQLELINMQMDRQRQRQEQRQRYRQRQLEALADNEDEYSRNGNNVQYEQYDNTNPAFSYKYPNVAMNDDILRDRITFAVGPSDPRYYAQANTDDDSAAISGEESKEERKAEEEEQEEEELDSRVLDEYEEYAPDKQAKDDNKAKMREEDINPIVLSPAQPAQPPIDQAATTTFHRIKPQSAAAAAVAAGVNAASLKQTHGGASLARHDFSALLDKLHKEDQSASAVLKSGPDEQLVVRQHLGIDGEMGMYVVALIAGVSAAATVGLFALGIAWYTLHNRSKAAADVEYPAYGVTGPNKDISPSGDRKLAQSAQMYHYQHQKQQIIAMENRQAAEENCEMSYVESDDDNEEGDYTVYECPGLAPTGEMEVKNPLFLDDTPVTPSVATATVANQNITQATAQQPPTVKKVFESAQNDAADNASSSQEKKQKKAKK